jgi:hypothetical protein
VTVNVTTPVAVDEPLAAEIVELPLPAVRDTALPVTGLPPASFRVTVIVEVVAPSARTDVGLAVTVDTEALTAPVVILKALLVAVPSPELVAVSV